MKEFNELTHQEKAMVLSLFAFKTGCLYYNVASLILAFKDTSDETKQYYIKYAKEFIKTYNLVNREQSLII